jgi:hypothetical protein
MSTAVAALSWELLARNRLFLSLTGLSVLLLSLVGVLLPEALRIPEVGVTLALLPASALAVAVALLSHGDCRLEVAASCFPARLFTLPVPTPVLVAPPLLLGTLIILACWLLGVVCLLLPCGADVPVWWPGVLMAAALALLQAFVWAPFPLPWLRLVCLVLVWPVMVWTVALLAAWEVREGALVVVSLLLLLAGYAGALAGVNWARRGLWVREPIQQGPVAVATERGLTEPFSSPLQAQLWLEWRMHFWLFLFVTVLCLELLLPSLWLADRVWMEAKAEKHSWLAWAQETVGIPWLLMGYLLTLPFLLSMGLASGLGRMTTWRGSHRMSAFLATRPVRTVDLVKYKLITGALGTLCMWSIVIAAEVGFAAWMGHIDEMAERLVALTGSVPTAVAALLGGLGALMAISWLWVVANLWAGALGRQLVEGLPLILGLAFCLIATLLVKVWQEEWWSVLGWMVAVALLGKVLAIVWVVSRLRRERLLEDRELRCALLGWGALAAFVLAMALWLVPGGGSLVAGVTLLLLPLARCLAAPLALASNRTR